ncbi:MAG: AraC family transcriptional regulator [Clostridia bacterium]|nr:AraC family transcriptional regulator [Clostridia bacterium]
MNNMDNIISNLSVRIIMSFRKKHDSTWKEHYIKTNYTLWSIMRGNIYIRADGREYIANQGDAVLFYPGTEYFASTDEDGCDFVIVRFGLEMGNGIDLFNGLNLAGIAKGLTDKTLKFCHDYMQDHKIARRTNLKQYMMFGAYISDVIDIQRCDRGILFYKRNNEIKRASFQDAIDYISKNYAVVTVRDAAKYMHMNEKRFITNFKKKTGISPGQYIIRCKMMRAAELLSDTSMKISDIASTLGFSDQYAFSKAFKNSFGESPTAFRQSAS